MKAGDSTSCSTQKCPTTNPADKSQQDLHDVGKQLALSVMEKYRGGAQYNWKANEEHSAEPESPIVISVLSLVLVHLGLCWA